MGSPTYIFFLFVKTKETALKNQSRDGKSNLHFLFFCQNQRNSIKKGRDEVAGKKSFQIFELRQEVHFFLQDLQDILTLFQI